MTTKTFAVGILVAAMASAAVAADNSVEFELRYWVTDLSGEVRVDLDEGGTRLDLDSALGFDDEDFFEVRFNWRPIRKLKLWIDYLAFDFSGQSTIMETFEFGGVEFDIDASLRSDLDVDYYRIGGAWQFISWGEDRYRLGPLLEVKAVQGDARLDATIVPFSASASEDFEAASAAAGLLLELEPNDKLEFFAEGAILVGHDEGDLLDAEAGVRYFPTDIIGILAGYRLFDLDFEDSRAVLELELSGVFLGLMLRF